MKYTIKLIVLFGALFAFSTSSFAAFPVLEDVPTTQESIVITDTQTPQDAPEGVSASGEKSQLVALLLCIFLGGLGIHRFYLGYTGIGVIQLLTAGGFGVWALIDLIMIITGDLKPKDGEYDTTL